MSPDFAFAVLIEHHRVYVSEFTRQIGKWICYPRPWLTPAYPRDTALCVVDDFGDLVGVSQ